MSFLRSKTWGIIAIVGLACCENHSQEILPPQIELSIEPATGLTTTNFAFDLSESFVDPSGNNQGLVRFDWNSDSVWDTPFIKGFSFKHRFLVPGEYHAKALLLDLNRNSDTAYFTLVVNQGYSAPIPSFNVNPESGNIITRFTFNAMETLDYEDSLSTLRFRWDFDSDGAFDTYYLDSCKYSRIFSHPKEYLVTLEVSDPAGLSAMTTQLVNVHLRDSFIKPDFIVYPDPEANVVVTLDASNSIDLRFPKHTLEYQWDFDSDDNYGTYWDKSPRIKHTFKAEIPFLVGLRVRNEFGLIGDTIKIVDVGHKNIKPKINLLLSATGGNLETQFVFNLWGCSDLESSPSKLKIRFDWDSNGLWDTPFLEEKIIYHSFDKIGKNLVAIEVIDEGGLSDLMEQEIYISDKEYQTDILLDKRSDHGYQHYGTVKIGDLWWFACNLNVQEFRIYNQVYYDDEYNNHFNYGCLYSVNYHKKICPDGWRIPTRADWQNLFNNFEEDQVYEELSPSGSSGFNASFGGIGSGVGYTTFSGQNKWGWYLSQTRLQNHEENVWIISFDKNNQKAYQGYKTSDNYYSVRCVKDD